MLWISGAKTVRQGRFDAARSSAQNARPPVRGKPDFQRGNEPPAAVTAFYFFCALAGRRDVVVVRSFDIPPALAPGRFPSNIAW